MPIPFPTHEWTQVFKDRLNASPAYAEIAKNWEGDICFHIDMAEGQPPALLYMDLWHGQCRAAYQVTEGMTVNPAFRLSAPLANFIKILTGQLDPMQAMVTGKLKVQGNMVMLMRNVPTVLEFVKTAKQIETEFLV